MFPWKTLASHGLFHMCVRQTISPEIGVFRRVGCLSSPVNHGDMSKNKDWSYGVVCFFFPSQSLSYSPLLLLHLSSTKCQSNSERVGCVLSESPTWVTHTQTYLKACHWLALSPRSDRVIPSLRARAPLSVLLQPHRPPCSSSCLSRLDA